MHGETHNFEAGLQAMTDDARRAAAIQARRQRHDRRVTSELSGTFAGTLIEIGETGSAATVLTRTGATLRGQIIAVGPEFVGLRTAERHEVIVRQRAIEGVREPGHGHDRSVDVGTAGFDLADVLDNASTMGRRVAFTLTSGNTLAGRIDRVGIDQAVLTLDGDGETITVPLQAIDQVVIA